MTQEEINALTQLAKDGLKKVSSKEEALEIFVKAGILDKNGKFTKPYKNLGTFMDQQNSSSKKNKDFLDGFSDSQKEDISVSIKESERGETTPHSQVIKKYKKWL